MLFFTLNTLHRLADSMVTLGEPRDGQVSEKGCFDFWIHPKAQSTLGEQQWDKSFNEGYSRGDHRASSQYPQNFFFLFFLGDIFSPSFGPPFLSPTHFLLSFFSIIYHHMNVTRKITYIEELTYGMVNAEGKRNLEKFKHHFL